MFSPCGQHSPELRPWPSPASLGLKGVGLRAERDAAVSAGCALASLGQMTLRADAVGLVAVSIVNFTFDDR